MRQAVEPIVLNGSHGEGGGALLRTALTMAAMTQQATRVHNIRGALRRKGLNAEDLTFLQAVARICDAEVEGDDLDSEAVVFRPKRPVKALTGRFDVHSHMQGRVPGSSLIVLSSLLPILARSGAYSQITVFGETHNNNTLGFDAFARSSVAALRRMGLYAFPALVSTGFGMGGRGEVYCDVEPSALNGVDWRLRGPLVACGAEITVSEMAPEATERAKASLEQLFTSTDLKPDVEVTVVQGRESGLSVTVWAEHETGFGSGSAVLQRGLTVPQTALRAWQAFQDWHSSTASVDAFLADQLLLPAVFADGKTVLSTPNVTRRLITMAWTVKQFLPIKVTIVGREGEPGTLTVER
ncbi:MAG: hypothetical protein JSS65_01550 [Armatimonadetes bacterium]|nr:hypothetical protein [Armatimonadota bacterium]